MTERTQVTALGRILIVILLLIPVALLATCFREPITDAIDDVRGTSPQAREITPEAPLTPAAGLPAATATAVVGRTPTPTATGGTGQATPRPGTRTPTATAPPAPQGTVVCAYDAFDPYHKCAYMEAKRLIPGVNFQARGFGLQLPNTSEAQKLTDLSAGKYHVLLTTLDACALYCDQNAVILGLVDASTGADMFVTRAEVNTLNDMAGKAACFVDGSVSEAFFLELFGPLQIVDQVRRVPKETLEDAIAAFEAGECQGVSGWQPDMLHLFDEEGRPKPGYKLIADTSRFQYVIDAIIANKQWAQGNPQQAQAVVDGWFRALKDSTENNQAYSRALIDAMKNVKPVDPEIGSWEDWSGIDNDRVLGERLSKIVAEASLDQNAEAMSNPEILARRIDEARSYWQAGGKTPQSVPARDLVDNRFVLAAVENGALRPNRAPLNRTFYLAERIPLPALTPQEQEALRRNVVAKLPIEKLDFFPDSAELRPGADAPLIQIAELIKRTPGVYLVIEGRAALPCGQDPQGTIDFARARAERVARVITADPLVQRNQVVVTWPKTDEELRQRLRAYNSCVESELEQDRVVLFTLNLAGQR
jgi:ABC-type nitrate/sulfonate/bicarbonate transport system substrate-binding protein